MKGLVSVVIPTFNRCDVLRRAIQSAQSQTYKHLEVLVCDDGSTDNTKMVVEGISEKDQRVKWISGKHSGLPAVPRNRGIKKSKGEWVAFLDDDDEWMPRKIEQQLKFAKYTSYSLICSNALKVSKSRKRAANYFPSNNPKSIKFSTLLKTNPVINSSVLIKKKALVWAGSYDESSELKAIEDYALWLRMASKYKLGYLDKVLLRYTDNPENSIRKNFSNHKEIFIVIFRNYIKWCKNNNVYSFKLLLTVSRLNNLAK